jgi:hypothetical protein
MIFRLSLLLGALLLTGFSEPKPAPKPFDSIEAAKQGRTLVEEILAQRPAQNFTNSGVLKIRDAQRKRKEVSVKFELFLTTTNWQSLYVASWTNQVETLVIIHAADQPDAYFYHTNYFADRVPLLGDIPVLGHLFRSPKLTDAELVAPFAGSDFWLADLGLEFFHWPEQKILKTELRKSRLCRVLESINPQPTTNAYSRVVSWVDDESAGIIHAEAYDLQNKLLKEFDAKKIKKVKGEWQLEEMEISNVQSGSRTQIEFNFDAK